MLEQDSSCGLTTPPPNPFSVDEIMDRHFGTALNSGSRAGLYAYSGPCLCVCCILLWVVWLITVQLTSGLCWSLTSCRLVSFSHLLSQCLCIQTNVLDITYLVLFFPFSSFLSET
ncbi:mCG147242 [Mus musculus]|nr:mCG147242 [Mus musculus]